MTPGFLACVIGSNMNQPQELRRKMAFGERWEAQSAGVELEVVGHQVKMFSNQLNM